MQDIVIVPTFDRPEMLWLCLEYLSRCPEIQTLDVRVVVDAHVEHPPPRAEIDEVLEKFSALPLTAVFRPLHRFAGNSFNVLMAYKAAYESHAPRVYLVEDDVLIRPEFFAWHRLKLLDAACSIGVVKEPHHGPYVSLGVGFNRETLKLIIPHCTQRYFANMRVYCRSRFPPSKFDCEQDGLWARVLVHSPVTWAVEPLAQHVGWYGYHRKKSVRPRGSLSERFDQVKRALGNQALLREWSKDFRDVVPLQSPCN